MGVLFLETGLVLLSFCCVFFVSSPTFLHYFCKRVGLVHNVNSCLSISVRANLGSDFDSLFTFKFKECDGDVEAGMACTQPLGQVSNPFPYLPPPLTPSPYHPLPPLPTTPPLWFLMGLAAAPYQYPGGGERDNKREGGRES